VSPARTACVEVCCTALHCVALCHLLALLPRGATAVPCYSYLTTFIFPKKSPYFRKRALHVRKRALYFRKRALISAPESYINSAAAECIHLRLHPHVCCNTLQHTATHCNTLQHTATHCNTLQHTATQAPRIHTTAPGVHR